MDLFLIILTRRNGTECKSDKDRHAFCTAVRGRLNTNCDTWNSNILYIICISLHWLKINYINLYILLILMPFELIDTNLFLKYQRAACIYIKRWLFNLAKRMTMIDVDLLDIRQFAFNLRYLVNQLFHERIKHEARNKCNYIVRNFIKIKTDIQCLSIHGIRFHWIMGQGPTYPQTYSAPSPSVLANGVIWIWGHLYPWTCSVSVSFTLMCPLQVYNFELLSLTLQVTNGLLSTTPTVLYCA